MTLLAHAIATEEGYGIPGTVPTRDNNPGDLRHSPHSFHLGGQPNGIGIIDNPQDGWADLERQLQLYASRKMTLRQAVYEFAPPTENNTAAYLNFVLKFMGMDQTQADMPMTQALEVA